MSIATRTGSYAFNVWSKRRAREKLAYSHANALTRELVDHPKDWPRSSWPFCAKAEGGLLAIDSVR